LALWQQFNYEYLILVSPDKQAVAEGILGENLDPVASWQGAVRRAEEELARDSNDIRARFNLSVALYGVGDYKRSVEEFEKISSRLPQIVLWYQMQPINSYFELGDHAKVMSWANAILARNVSFSELYILRGKVYLQQGRPELAKKEFEQALFYNKNLKSAQEALSSV
jgi:tetratricopeptide (TPR) repeat protein